MIAGGKAEWSLTFCRHSDLYLIRFVADEVPAIGDVTVDKGLSQVTGLLAGR
jgi:hypothetical protein